MELKWLYICSYRYCHEFFKLALGCANHLVTRLVWCVSYHQTRFLSVSLSNLHMWTTRTYSLRKLKWELLGKTVLLLATVVYQARRAVPALKDCQSANINRLMLALMSRSWCAPQTHVQSRTSIAFFSPFTPQVEQIWVDAYQGPALMSVRP